MRTCECGEALALSGAAEEVVACRRCGKRYRVKRRPGPDAAASRGHGDLAPPLHTSRPLDVQVSRGHRMHPRLRMIYTALVVGVASLTLVGLVLGLFNGWLFLLVIPLLALAWGAGVRIAVRLMRTTAAVLKEKDITLFGGFVRVIAWDPTEGVVILKNKQISEIDDSLEDGGGIALLFPSWGEELDLRVPLEIQTLRLEEIDVPTREYVPLEVHGTVYWRITNLERFYHFVSREIHRISDRKGDHAIGRPSENPKLEAAEQWLRFMSEEQTRNIVSRVSTGLLFADRLADEVPGAQPSAAAALATEPRPETPHGYQRAADGLAEAIQREMGGRVREYGIEIHRVALQRVTMPEDVWQAAVKACRSAYELVERRREALGERMRLEAEADVIGREHLALREVLKEAPSLGANQVVASILQGFLETTMGHDGLPSPDGKAVLGDGRDRDG